MKLKFILLSNSLLIINLFSSIDNKNNIQNYFNLAEIVESSDEKVAMRK
jgi:hypothetical protein